MKRKLSLFILLLCILIIAPACNSNEQIAAGSLKALTKPYIATYECTQARLGGQDLLEKYDYIKITLLNKDELEVSFKQKNGDKKSFKGKYEVNAETKELKGEIGILGFTFKETVKIEKGKFVINQNFLSLSLIMVFEMQ